MTKFSVVAHKRPLIGRYLIPDEIIGRVEAWFQEAGRAGVEDIAILAGYTTASGDAIAATALHPDAEREVGWYEQRDGPQWGALYTFAHQHGMHYLLQIHTHPPGSSTHHSHRDDAGAFSDEPGFVSIVIPDFAERGLDLADPAATIHERTRVTANNTRGWRVWSREEVLDRIRVVPLEKDYQSKQPESRRVAGWSAE